MICKHLFRVVFAAFQLEENLERELPCLMSLAHHREQYRSGERRGPYPADGQVAKATLETKTFTSPTSRPSMRSVASTTLAWTAAATSASFASESTVMKTSR